MKRLVAVLVLMAMTAQAETTVSPASTPSSVNDTYNFYLQKAPGPQTVSQGGSESPPSAVSNSSSTQSSSAPSTQDKIDFYPWALSLASSYLIDASGLYEGLGFSVQHNFSRYWALDGGLTVATGSGEGGNPFGGYEKRSGVDIFDLHAGGRVTPVYIKVFEETLVEIGMGFGLQTLVDEYRPEYHQYSEDRRPVSIRKNFVPYLSLQFAINFTKQLSAEFVMRISEAKRAGAGTVYQAGGISARYRF